MKLYTRTGDNGSTGLYGAERVEKTHPRVEAYGTVDELSSLLGVARAQNMAQPTPQPELEADLYHLQDLLYELGSDLATRIGSPYASKVRRIDVQDITELEALIDRYSEAAPPLKHFIHPAGTPVAAALHLARAVARRAERDVLRLMAAEDTNPQTQIWLNRVSDLLFAMARATNIQCGVAEETLAVRPRTTEDKGKEYQDS